MTLLRAAALALARRGLSSSSSSSSAAAAAAPARAADLLASRAADATDAIALIEPSTSTRWSYGELNDRALAFARGLDEMGYVPGAKLGVRLDNCNELLVAMLGASARGIDVETAKTMDALARDVRCRGTLVHHLDAAAAGAMPGAHEPIAIRGGAVSDPIVHWDIMIDAFRGWDAPMPPVREREGGGGGGGGSGGDGDDGRTTSSSFFFNAPGKPTCEAALLAHGVAAADALSMTRDDRVCVAVPLSHAMGFGFGVLAAMRVGAAVVLPSPAGGGDAISAAMVSERCTLMLADSHATRALPGDAGGATTAPKGWDAFRGGLTKVGSGDGVGDAPSVRCFGVALTAVGKAPQPA